MKKFDQINSILLIDDDESSNFVHSIFINKLGLDVDIKSALNGKEGLDFILDKGVEQLALPCMVMLDLRMPVVDGWEFMRMYAEQVPQEIKDQLVVIMVTVSNDAKDIKKADGNPFVMDYAQKPLSDSTFKKLISKHFKLPIAV